MAITNIKRDWGIEPSIVRISSTNTLAEVGTTGYILDQADEIFALNAGEFEWSVSDMVLVYASDGWGFFTISSDFESLDAFVFVPGVTLPTVIGNLAEFDSTGGNLADSGIAAADVQTKTLADGSIWIGDSSNEAQAVAVSHITKFGGQHTTVGGGAAEAITVTGALTTDLAFVQLVDPGTNTVSVVQAVVTANTLTVTFSADPGNDAVINYQLLRAST